MKLAFLGARNSSHLVKLVNEMSRRGHEVHLITMHPGNEKNIDIDRVHLYNLPFPAHFGYYSNTPFLKKILKMIKPDVLNVHYSSGYGTLARLSGFHPILLSVWGSDVFSFPYESSFKRKVIVKNLEYADQIASTSKVMKRQIESLVISKKSIAVTPFGVDCQKFCLLPKTTSQRIRIGTVKALAPVYGIKYLIEAFSVLKNSGLDIELCLVGKGPQEQELRDLVKKLGIQDDVQFVGYVPNDDVPKWLNTFDIYVALSLEESFGVAVLEASACGLPVIVSDAGGLPEVVLNEETGFIVPRNNVDLTVEKLNYLISEQDLRLKMGQKGRKFVLENYEWSKCADLVETLYIQTNKEYSIK